MNRVNLKYLVFSVILISSFGQLKSQDLIITIFQDSIHCRVDKTTDAFIYYRTRKTKRNTSDIISRKEVLEVIYNFEDQYIPTSKLREYDLFEVYGTFTGSRLLSEIPRSLPNEFSEYLDQLKWGIGFSAGLNFNFARNYGIGFLFTQTEFNNSVDVMQVGTSVTGTLSDEIRMTYLGLGFVLSGDAENAQTVFQLNVGLGYLLYLNEARTIYPYRVQGNSLGGHLLGSANFSLGSGVFIPVQFGLKGFSVSSLDLSFPSDLPDEFREGISLEVMSNEPINVLRLELSIGLLISF
jgi:hypothetical protein